MHPFKDYFESTFGFSYSSFCVIFCLSTAFVVCWLCASQNYSQRKKKIPPPSDPSSPPPPSLPLPPPPSSSEEEKYHQDAQFLLQREYEITSLETTLDQNEQNLQETLRQLTLEERKEEKRKRELQAEQEKVEWKEEELKEGYGLDVDVYHDNDNGHGESEDGCDGVDGEEKKDDIQEEEEDEEEEEDYCGSEEEEEYEQYEDYEEEEDEDYEEEAYEQEKGQNYEEEDEYVEPEDEEGEEEEEEYDEDDSSVSSYEQQLSILREAALQHQRMRDQARAEGFQLLHKLEQQQKQKKQKQTSVQTEDATATTGVSTSNNNYKDETMETEEEEEEAGEPQNWFKQDPETYETHLKQFEEYLNNYGETLGKQQEQLIQREKDIVQREQQLKINELELFRRNLLPHPQLIKWDDELVQREEELVKKEEMIRKLRESVASRKDNVEQEKSINDAMERELVQRKRNLKVLEFVLDLRMARNEMFKLNGVPYEKPDMEQEEDKKKENDGDEFEEVTEKVEGGDRVSHKPSMLELEGEYEMVFYYNVLPSCCDSEYERCRTLLDRHFILSTSKKTTEEEKVENSDENGNHSDCNSNYIGTVSSKGGCFPQIYVDSCGITSFGLPRECWRDAGSGEAFLHVLSKKQPLYYYPDSGLEGTFPSPFSSSSSSSEPNKIIDAENLLERYRDASSSWLCHHDMCLPEEVALNIREFVCPPPVFFLEKGDLCLSIKGVNGCSGVVIFARRKK